MDLSQLDDQCKWRRSALGLRKEYFGKPWNYCFRVPRDPCQLFKWIISLDLPRLEDETPPWSFYSDLLEARTVQLDRSPHSGKLLVSLGSQTVEQSTSASELTTSSASEAEVLTGSVEMERAVEMGSDPDMEASAPGATPPDNQQAKSPRQLGSLVKKMVLTVSVLHSLFVLSRIALGGSHAGGWGAWPGVPPPAQIDETPWCLPAGAWQYLVSKLGALRSAHP
ncbi:uncharacterized protein LOC108097074 [Drosophila ficusphila]|uniref:uncharacterized protein LOC108097074 n=1 Tax=Drosophila ficusphila TaxID=30025 RepID=UPI0007E69A29|nr:uncharacterized protein LOC108097074 [Drosophila ficusphila]